MRIIRSAGVLVAFALLSTFLNSPPAAAAQDVEVRINARAFEGPRGTVLASFQARCQPGNAFAYLFVDWQQGTTVTAPTPVSPFPCDGTWRTQRVRSDEAFHPGPLDLTVRFGVTDLGTGGPGQSVTAHREIYVRPAAVVQLPRTATLRRDGSVRITLTARCDRPWVLQDFGVTLEQGVFPDLAAGSRSYTQHPPCDGTFHTVTFYVHSVQDVVFRRGWADARGSLSLLDPDNGDPVTSAGAERRIWIR